MKFDLNIIASALSMGRGVGKTYAMIQSAPKGCVILTVSNGHAADLRREIEKQGRTDLSVSVGSRNLLGLRGPFIADHFAVESWLREAFLDGEKLRKDRDEWKAKYDRLRNGYDAIKHRMDGLEK